LRDAGCPLRRLAVIFVGPKGVAVLPEGRNQSANLRFRNPIWASRPGSSRTPSFAWFEEELEVPVVEAELPERFALVIELSPARGTQDLHPQLVLGLRSHQDRLYGGLVGNRAEQSFRG
jgi:hypothetical protein